MLTSKNILIRRGFPVALLSFWMSMVGMPQSAPISLEEESIIEEDLSILSDRILDYRIEVDLDPVNKTVKGHEILTWNNRSGQSIQNFCFHLYLNAFRNNRSTFVREGRFQSLWSSEKEIPENYWGFTQVDSVQVVPPGRQVTGLDYIHPDDDNEEDRSVLMVQVDEPLPPGEAIQFRIDFESKLPRGTRRTGWAEDYFFMAQWFPKIGVFEEDGWNCHQYHRSTEYFADFGVYDVSLTVPGDFVVGATGKRMSEQENDDGRVTYRYYQEDVHDFAWTASPRFLERRQVFTDPVLPEVEMTLLLLPEHEHLEERYFTATDHALRYYGRWFGAYPYPTITVVDPGYRSSSGGMEYPTFLTGGTHFWAPANVLRPEDVTIHEVGHQWWYGMSASNEFEESWLDEGLNSWSESRVQKTAYSPSRYMVRFFGGIPFVFNSLEIPFETASLSGVRRSGQADIMTRRGWEYRNRPSYRTNSYSKPEMILWTLERWLGEETMLEAMRTFFQQYHFKHPTTQNFIDTFNEVAPQDLDWFFEETFFSSELVDYAIGAARSTRIPQPEGIFDDGHVLPSNPREDEEEDEEDRQREYLTEVVVERLEGARFPVDVLMVFDDGEEIRRSWDGQDRWHRYSFQKPVRLEYAVVDPDRKLLLDIDPTNNSRYRSSDEGFALATRKWAFKWLFWLQNLLETISFLA